MSNKITGLECSKFTTEEAEYLVKRLMDTFIQYGVSSYDFDSMIRLFKRVCGNKIDSNIFVRALFEKGFFKKYKYNSQEIRSFIDEIISKGKFDNAIELINLIKEQLPDYVNFPLIIMNDNIDSEEKIKALKLVYRQKDFPKYKEYFRDNLVNLQHLDDFIEATIMQNNRVKEKDANLIKLFKDIFVHGDYRGSRNIFNRNGILNKKEFSQKYSEKFSDPKFAKKFYIETVDSMSTLQWERKEQYKSFMSLIFSSYSINEQIEVMTKVPQLKCLGEGFNEKFSEAWFNKDYDSCRDLLRVFIAWSEEHRGELFRQLSSCCGEVYNVLRKFSYEGIMDDYLKDFKLLNFETENDYFYLDLPNRFSLPGVLNTLFDEKIFNKVKFFEEDIIDCLGFNYKKILDQFKIGNNYNNKYSYYRYDIRNLAPRIQDVNDALYDAINDLILFKSSTNLKKDVLEKFFARFENDEKTSFLVENFTSLGYNELS